MGVMAKVAANAGLSPGLAVLSQKFAEMFYVAMTVFTSCAPCRAAPRAPPRDAGRGDSTRAHPAFFLLRRERRCAPAAVFGRSG